VLSVLKQTSDERSKIESKNRDNVNDVSDTLQKEEQRLETTRDTMKKLYDEMTNLNATIQDHYNRLTSDTDYIASLDAMRPAFLKSLDKLSSHVNIVKTVVDNKLIKDEYKDEMIELLSKIQFDTHNISGYVATAFINHYNKYKKLSKTETTEYSADLKQLSVLANEYKVQSQKYTDIEKERSRLKDILSKLNTVLSNSVTQRDEYNRLTKEIVSIFEKRKC
jgi:predicted nucleic acid-binding protein